MNVLTSAGSAIEGASAVRPSGNLPKLTILLDPLPEAATAVDDVAWSKVAGQPGRGPTLRLRLTDAESIEQEVFAAIDSVWPGLCPAGTSRIK